MNKRIKYECDGCQYRGRHIYVVGSLRFERELMAQFIAAHTVSTGFQADNLEEVPIGNKGVPFGQKMILIDTHSYERDDLVRLLLSKSWKNHSHNLMAFFNLLHEYEIEKEALRNGVRGFLYEGDPVEDLINGICAINSGELWISRRIVAECLKESYIGRELPQSTGHSLSVREVELLRILITGASNDTIADQMFISPHTVKSHMHNIFNKIEVGNRLQAVLWATKNL